MSEQIPRGLKKVENRQDAIKSQELEGKGMLYFNEKKVPVELVDSRAGGIGIKISKRSLDRLQLQTDNRIELELPISTDKYEKYTFIVRHITPMGLKYKIGLQYADGSKMSVSQRNIESSNRL